MSTRYMTEAAAIAALYVVLCVVFRPISFSVFQCRIAEALVVLPYFTSAAIPGLSVGCLLANILCGADIFDIIFGTVATVIGALGTYAIRKHKYLAALPPIVSNSVIIPLVLAYAYGQGETVSLFVIAGSVFGGELTSCGVLGTLLLMLLDKYKEYIFRK